ncbi:MAG: UDP-glucose 4-epimerase, partial [uncultured Nocardioidaceae bacterium]
DRRRRLHRLDHRKGSRGGRAHTGHPRLAALRPAGLRQGPDLLRGRHRRPRPRREGRRGAPRHRLHDPHGCPHRGAGVGGEALRVLPRQRREVAGAVRPARFARQAAGAVLLQRVPLRQERGLRGRRGLPARAALAVRPHQAGHGDGAHRHGGGHGPARDRPALLQPDRFRPRPRVRHLRARAVARAGPAGDGGAGTQGRVHDHRDRAPDAGRDRHPRLHPRVGPGPGPRRRRRALRRGADRGAGAEHGHQHRHRRRRHRPGAGQVVRAGVRQGGPAAGGAAAPGGRRRCLRQRRQGARRPGLDVVADHRRRDRVGTRMGPAPEVGPRLRL